MYKGRGENIEIHLKGEQKSNRNLILSDWIPVPYGVREIRFLNSAKE